MTHAKVAALLRGLQFDVIEAADLDRSAFVNAVGTFSGKRQLRLLPHCFITPVTASSSTTITIS